jgi:hypothetical protein
MSKDSILEMISDLKNQNNALKQELEYFTNGYSLEIPKIYWFVMAIFVAAIFYLGFVTMSACAAEREGIVAAEIINSDDAIDSSITFDELPEDIDPAAVDSIDGKYRVVNF